MAQPLGEQVQAVLTRLLGTVVKKPTGIDQFDEVCFGPDALGGTGHYVALAVAHRHPKGVLRAQGVVVGVGRRHPLVMPGRRIVDDLAVSLEIGFDGGDQVVQKKLPADVCLHAAEEVPHPVPLVRHIAGRAVQDRFHGLIVH
ncbi:MAG: hypothetical protein QF582_23615 [Alphaproteobacteria bacterium]|jgi:hypothetical protein|nr:hypothetical protein [Alphaproteobacteria bacterium]